MSDQTSSTPNMLPNNVTPNTPQISAVAAKDPVQSDSHHIRVKPVGPVLSIDKNFSQGRTPSPQPTGNSTAASTPSKPSLTLQLQDNFQYFGKCKSAGNSPSPSFQRRTILRKALPSPSPEFANSLESPINGEKMLNGKEPQSPCKEPQSSSKESPSPARAASKVKVKPKAVTAGAASGKQSVTASSSPTANKKSGKSQKMAGGHSYSRSLSVPDSSRAKTLPLPGICLAWLHGFDSRCDY